VGGPNYCRPPTNRARRLNDWPLSVGTTGRPPPNSSKPRLAPPPPPPLSQLPTVATAPCAGGRTVILINPRSHVTGIPLQFHSGYLRFFYHAFNRRGIGKSQSAWIASEVGHAHLGVRPQPQRVQAHAHAAAPPQLQRAAPMSPRTFRHDHENKNSDCDLPTILYNMFSSDLIMTKVGCVTTAAAATHSAQT
jgi:hypothetical protein